MAQGIFRLRPSCQGGLGHGFFILDPVVIFGVSTKIWPLSQVTLLFTEMPNPPSYHSHKPLLNSSIYYSTSCSHKAAKIHLTSSVPSSLTGASKYASSTAASPHTASSQMLPSKKVVGQPVKLNCTDALAEELQGAIVTLADTLQVTAEDPIAAIHHTATEMINADTVVN